MTTTTPRFGESAYQVLGLDLSSAPFQDAQVARAYRQASLQAHPDKPNGSKAKFERIQTAYAKIKTVKQRALYDQYGSRMGPGPGHLLGAAMDKIWPLVLGLLGGLLVVTLRQSADINVLLLITVVSLGGGTLLSYKVPLLEALTAGVGGMLIGSSISSIGGFVYGVVSWSFSF